MQSEVKNFRPKCDIIDLLKVVKTIENTEEKIILNVLHPKLVVNLIQFVMDQVEND